MKTATLSAILFGAASAADVTPAEPTEVCMNSDVIMGQTSTAEGGMGGWGCYSRANGNWHGNCHTHKNYQGHSTTFHIHGSCHGGSQGGIRKKFPTVKGDVYTLKMECFAGAWDGGSDVDYFEISTDGGSNWKKFGCNPTFWQNIEHKFTAKAADTDLIIWSDKNECIDIDNIQLDRCAKPKYGAKCHPDMCDQWKCTGREEGSWCHCWEEGVEYPKCPSDDDDEDTCQCFTPKSPLIPDYSIPMTLSNWNLVGGAKESHLAPGAMYVSHGNGYAETVRTFQRPIDVSIMMKQDTSVDGHFPKNMAECGVVQVFPQSNTRHTGYNAGSNWWGNQFGAGVDGSIGGRGTMNGKNFEWNTVRINVQRSGQVDYYFNGELRYTAYDNKYTSGSIRIGHGCMGYDFKNLKVVY